MAPGKGDFVAGIPDQDPNDGPGEAPAVTGDRTSTMGSLSIERIPVEGSTHLASVGYNDQTGILVVEFKDGEIYEYENVPQDVMVEFITAKSQGSYFQRNIAQMFRYRQIA